MEKSLPIQKPIFGKLSNYRLDVRAYHPLQHLLFWIGIYVCSVIANWDDYYSTNEVFITQIYRLTFQIASAYTFLWMILPRYEQKKNKFELIGTSILLLVVIHTVFRYFKVTYFEPTYPETYTWCAVKFAGWTLTDRLLNVKDLIFKGPIMHFLPGLLLIALQYFQKQQKILKLNEQKKTTELNHLKNQLNPHFLFNTLNNLYALAKKKSDKTPEVISKLSEILDYTLYGCNQAFVPISKEVDLIHNYLALEKVRYGERTDVTFKTDIQYPVSIAPMLLLTFIENAFKHGVAQELHQAIINMNLTTTNDTISFSITNSIPKTATKTEATKQGIGLKNIQQQLSLLYPNAHQLKIEEINNQYHVHLTIIILSR